MFIVWGSKGLKSSAFMCLTICQGLMLHTWKGQECTESVWWDGTPPFCNTLWEELAKILWEPHQSPWPNTSHIALSCKGPSSSQITSPKTRPPTHEPWGDTFNHYPSNSTCIPSAVRFILDAGFHIFPPLDEKGTQTLTFVSFCCCLHGRKSDTWRKPRG